jgi:hypothetical protein
MLEHKHRYLACRRRLGELNRSSTTSSRSPFLTPKSGFEISRLGTTFSLKRAKFFYYWKLTHNKFFFLGGLTGQIVEKDPSQPHGPPETSLVEIGPRFVLTPIRIFEGAFGGATVFANPGKGSFLSGPGRGRYCFFVILKAFRFFHPQNLYPLHLSGLRDARRGAKSTRNASSRNKSKVSVGPSVSERRIHLLWPRSLPKMHRCLLASAMWRTRFLTLPFMFCSLAHRSHCNRHPLAYCGVHTVVLYFPYVV